MTEYLPEKMRRIAKEMMESFEAYDEAAQTNQTLVIYQTPQLALREAVRKVNYWFYGMADLWEENMPCPYCNGTGRETRDFALKGEPPIIGGYRIGSCRKGCEET